MAEKRDIPRLDFKTDANLQNLHQEADTLNLYNNNPGVSAYGLPVGPYTRAGFYNGPPGLSSFRIYRDVNSYYSPVRVPASGSYRDMNSYHGPPRVPVVGNYARLDCHNGVKRVSAGGSSVPEIIAKKFPRMDAFNSLLKTRAEEQAEARRELDRRFWKSGELLGRLRKRQDVNEIRNALTQSGLHLLNTPNTAPLVKVKKPATSESYHTIDFTVPSTSASERHIDESMEARDQAQKLPHYHPVSHEASSLQKDFTLSKADAPPREGSSASGFNFGDNAQVTIQGCSIAVDAGGSSVQQHTGSGAIPKSRGGRPDRVQLTGSICYFPNERIAKRVFHGEQTTLTGESRRIAVKTGFWDKNILKESKMLLKLGAHQNVVTYIDTGSYNHGETMFLAMELCHEQNLRQYTEARKEIGVPFDKTLAIEYAKQIVAGLVRIHDHGIIHRDLKPDNILFSRDQKYLKISDFDLSKEIGTQSTSFGQAGSEGYRAPEVINKGPISRKADIFSLGLVLHYIWSYGEHPYGSDPANWNYHISNNLNPDFSSLQLVPNARATNLIGWMLHFKPKLRPSIQEVGDDLSGSKKAPRYLPTGLREITIVNGRAVGSRYPTFLTEVERNMAWNMADNDAVMSIVQR